MKRISRRNFLKAMGISATALTLAGGGGGCPPPPPPSEPIEAR